MLTGFPDYSVLSQGVIVKRFSRCEYGIKDLDFTKGLAISVARPLFCCFPSRHLERLQQRQPLFSKLIGLASQFGQVIVGRLQRLALLDDALTLRLDDPPGVLRAPLPEMAAN